MTGIGVIASVMWVQSHVRDSSVRALLYDLDQAIQGLTVAVGAHDTYLLKLTNVYYNLLRLSAET